MVAARNARDSAGESPVPVREPGAAAGTGDLEVLAGIAARADGQRAGENFPVALRFLPRRPRADLLAVYRFARFVDDVGDEAPGGPETRERLLATIGDDVRRLDGGAPRLAPVAALAPLAGRVPATVFTDLVEANLVDQRVHSYDTFADLLGYCRLSAAPVGRAVLHVAGAATEANITDSDAVCAALQVLEHCQDVREDALAGRVYLPAEDLADVTALGGSWTPPAVRAAVAVQVGRSRDLLAAGGSLVGRLSGWARLAVAGYVAGGLATADALDAAGHDVLDRLIRPSKAATARHGVRLLRGRA